MKDERIQTTVNRFAAIGFYIWVFLMSASLCYRTLILKQHPREWWDIFAIYFIGIIFVSIAQASKGVLAHASKRFWLRIGITVVIVGIAAFTVVLFVEGRIPSVVRVGAFLVASLAGMGLAIGIVHLLNRRWKRKEGIEDEK